MKKATGVDTSEVVEKSDLVSLKYDVDELDIDKLETVSTELRKLSNIVDKGVAEKTIHDKLVTKGNNIDTNDTSKLVKKQNTIQELKKLHRKYPIIMNALLLMVLIHFQAQYSMKD